MRAEIRSGSEKKKTEAQRDDSCRDDRQTNQREFVVEAQPIYNNLKFYVQNDPNKPSMRETWIFSTVRADILFELFLSYRYLKDSRI